MENLPLNWSIIHTNSNHLQKAILPLVPLCIMEKLWFIDGNLLKMTISSLYSDN